MAVHGGDSGGEAVDVGGALMGTLTLDIRESKKTIELFRRVVPEKWPDWTVDVRKIEVGDFAVEDRVGIEHKAPADFLGCIDNGRLFQQAHELSQSYEKAFIVVDGVPRNLWSNSFIPKTADNIFGVLSSLAMRQGVPVLFTGNMAVHFVTQVMKLAEKSEGEGSYAYNPIRRSASGRELGLHIIGSLKGVGPSRARALLDHYGSPLNALNNYGRWHKDVKGIGTTTSEKAGQVLEHSSD